MFYFSYAVLMVNVIADTYVISDLEGIRETCLRFLYYTAVPIPESNPRQCGWKSAVYVTMSSHKSDNNFIYFTT